MTTSMYSALPPPPLDEDEINANWQEVPRMKALAQSGPDYDVGELVREMLHERQVQEAHDRGVREGRAQAEREHEAQDREAHTRCAERMRGADVALVDGACAYEAEAARVLLIGAQPVAAGVALASAGSLAALRRATR